MKTGGSAGSGTRKAKRRRVLVLCFLLFVFIFSGACLVSMNREIVERFEGKCWRLPSKIYSDSFSIYPGLSPKKSHVMERLRRLGYQQAKGSRLRKGEYRQGKNTLEIFLHDFLYPEGAFTGFPLQMALQDDVILHLKDLNRSGEEIFSANLEPELITGLFNKVWEERRIVRLSDVPASLVDAVIATEDQRFYEHIGIDPRAIARAALANLKARRVVQGASTLTQQLVKNFFLTPRRTIVRKIREALMALLVEVRYSKQEILEAYLNEVYFGQKGSLGVYGVGEASEFYFCKPVKALTLPESALLAAMIQAPSLYSPHKGGGARVLARRNRVLKKMLGLGMITENEYKKAVDAPIEVRFFYPQKNAAPYFVDYLMRELEDDYSLDILTSEGLLIFTSLDVEMQRTATEALQKGLERLEARAPSRLKPQSGKPKDILEGCLVSLEPQTGYIRAMVGGRDYNVSQFNRVVQARRQPGSLFKPIAYVAALQGKEGKPPRFTPSSLLRDEPIEIRYDGKSWSPKNFDDEYTGEVTLRTAMEKSLNCASVWLAERVGYGRILDTARDLGLTTPMEPVPSLVLGSFEAIPLEVASAYSVFANHGMQVSPRATKTVLDKDGKILERRPMKLSQAVSPEGAFLMTNILKGVMERGTARSVAGEIDVPAAGKTGTTNDYRDAWFVGYTSRLLALVWVGFDEPRNLGFGGAGAAVPIWADFMKMASGWLPPEDFVPPPGVVTVKIDRITGMRATSLCPDTIDEAFFAGTEPVGPCPIHRETVPADNEGGKRGIMGRFLDLFH